MKNDMTWVVEELTRTLRQISWRWDKGDMLSALAPLEPELAEAVRGRTTFRISDGLLLSVYHEGEKVAFLEITVESFENPHLLSESEYEDKVDEFFRKYEQAVKAAQAVLGKPQFDDGAGNQRFPEDQDAVWLALWPLNNARFMIQQKHEDKELPFRISLVVAPPQT